MASKYRKKFELPEGFYDVLENYSREVLRDQPLDIIEFSYLYFKALEEVRRKTFDLGFINFAQKKAGEIKCKMTRRFHLRLVLMFHFFVFSLVDHQLTFLFSVIQGTIDQFDYPKKGKNIPPSKHDAPPREEIEEEGEGEDQGEGEEAPSYYDEDGNRVEYQQDEYGGEEGQQDQQQNYGEEQQDYGNEQQEYGDEQQD